MFISEPKTFHDSIKPLVYFNCIAGNGALRQPNQSNTIFFLMNLYTVLLALFNWTTIYITLNPTKLYSVLENTPSMAVKMSYAVFYTNACITVTAPLFVWLQRKGLRDCLRQMPILDDTFQVILGVKNKYKKQYIQLNCRIIGIVLVMLGVAICDAILFTSAKFSMSIESVLTTCCLLQTIHYPILVMLLLDVNFCAFVGYLGNKFEDLNVSLLKLAEKPLISCPGERLCIISRKGTRRISENKTEDTEADDLVTDKHHLLQEIRKAHLELYKLYQKVNLIFGIQNLISSGISFVMITGALYNTYSAFVWEKLTDEMRMEVISTAIWCFIYVFKIWIVNHSCWSVSNEAERTGAVIYDLLNLRVDVELERKINEFGVQMLQNPIRFDACGFFTLDYTFVQGVIGSITTYLVIFIQLSPVPRPATSNPLVNVTEI